MTPPASPGRWRALVLGVPALLMVAIAASILTLVALGGNPSAANGSVVRNHGSHEPVVEVFRATVRA